MPTTRRGMLLAAGWAALPAGQAGENARLAELGRRLAGLLSGTHAARQIAAGYLAATGETDSRKAAVALNLPAVLAPANRIVAPEQLRRWLGARIREDFATGAVLDVAGWRLSRTEVGVCLLVSAVA
jgi:hypothetical protein